MSVEGKSTRLLCRKAGFATLPLYSARRDFCHGLVGSSIFYELRGNLRVYRFLGGLRWTAFEATRPELVPIFYEEITAMHVRL